MKMMLVLAPPVLLAAANAAAAQSPPSTHEQHQATGQHQVEAGEARCCCEQMMQEMHKMMSDMMRMHQGMAAHANHDAAQEKLQEQQKH